MFKPEIKNGAEKADSVNKRESIVIAPPSESLAFGLKDSLWPEQIKNNQELEEKALMRRKLSSSFKEVFSRLPEDAGEIRQAVESGAVLEEKAIEMLDNLSFFLSSEKGNERLILYLPFELIPEKKSESAEGELNDSISYFQSEYMDKWRELLHVHDIRANFIDGDVVEPELAESGAPLVAKAAHLIPILCSKGLLSVKEAIDIAEQDIDPITRESAMDSIPVLGDLGLLSKSDIDRLSSSDNSLIRNLAVIVKDSANKKNERGNKSESITTLAEKLDKEKNRIDYIYSVGNSRRSEAWSDWVKNREMDKVMERESEKIISVSQDELKEDIFLMLLNNNVNVSELGIHSLRKLIEEAEAEEAIDLYDLSVEKISKLWQEGNDRIKTAVEKMLYRLVGAGKIDRDELVAFGLIAPNIGEAFSPEKSGIDSKRISQAMEIIESDKKLSETFYPVSIAYGSKVKGYGLHNSDTDLAVFVKPGEETLEKNFQSELEPFLAEAGIKGGAMEFRLEENGEELAIKNPTKFDKFLADESLIHVLFNGAWIGKSEAIKDLYEKLMPGFLYSEGKKIGEKEARSAWLKELERDTLQYRLMHRGYLNSYPEKGGINTANSSAIDSDSAFWDDGYRRLASRLFVERVFLPELKEDK